MTVKEYLEQIKTLDIKIDQKQKQLDELRLKAYGDKSPSIGKSLIQSSPNGDQMESSVVRYVDLEHEIEVMIDNYTDTKNRIINEIHMLNNNLFIQLLFKRYVEYKQLDVIAIEMNYTEDYIRHVHGNALEAFRTKVLNRTITYNK